MRSGTAPALIDNGFADFWEKFPRKDAKKDAAKAWGQVAMTPALFECIMAALEVQNKYDFSRRQKKYVPLAATWIRGERWEDEDGAHYGNGNSGTREVATGNGNVKSRPYTPKQ